MRLLRLFLLLASAPGTAAAQMIYLPGNAPATVVQVRTPDNVPAFGTSVQILGTRFARSTDSDGRAIFPTLRRGDYLVSMQSYLDEPVIRAISVRGYADTVRLSLPRRMPTIRTQELNGAVELRLARAADRRGQGPGSLLAAERLKRFRSVGDAAQSFSPRPLDGPDSCVRISRDGAAPAGARLLRLAEAPAALPVGQDASARPAGRTTDADKRELSAGLGDVQAVEWIDAVFVPFSFVGVPRGCDVVVIWR